MIKQTTSIVDQRWKDKNGIEQWNGGMHDQRAYRKMIAMLHRGKEEYTSPRLYHIVLMGIMEGITTPELKGALKAICDQARLRGIDYMWRACLERDDEKGLHLHVFLLVESAIKIPNQFLLNDNKIKPINKKRQRYRTLYDILSHRGISYHLAPPKAQIHRTGGTMRGKRQLYATLAGDKLADCIEWISYLAKARSKPDDIKQIYFSSRDKKPAIQAINEG